MKEIQMENLHIENVNSENVDYIIAALHYKFFPLLLDKEN